MALTMQLNGQQKLINSGTKDERSQDTHREGHSGAVQRGSQAKHTQFWVKTSLAGEATERASGQEETSPWDRREQGGRTRWHRPAVRLEGRRGSSWLVHSPGFLPLAPHPGTTWVVLKLLCGALATKNIFKTKDS